MDKKYAIELYYGYEEGECGIYHSFRALEPGHAVNEDLIAKDLAEQLDCVPEDDRFNHNSMYIDLPVSLVEKIQQDAVRAYLAGKYVEPEELPKNTRIVYRYTDASNYHARNEAVLKGVLTDEQKQVILGCLDGGEFFIPGAVGLDVELPWEFVPQDDHPFWMIDVDSFEETLQKPTVNVTLEAFVQAFVDNKDRWEQLGVEYVAQFEEDFEGGVDEVISSAVEKSGSAAGKSEADRDIDLS